MIQSMNHKTTGRLHISLKQESTNWLMRTCKWISWRKALTNIRNKMTGTLNDKEIVKREKITKKQCIRFD